MQLSIAESIAHSKSLLESILNIANGRAIDGLAYEVSRELNARGGTENRANAIRIPLSRALATNVFSAAGSLVESSVGEIDPVLRSASVVLAAGGRMISGLTSNLAIPRQTGFETISFLHESDTLVATDSSFGELNLTPHRLSGATSLSRQLATQSNAAEFLTASLNLGIAHAIDKGALVGNGAAGDVLGLHSNPSVTTKTFGGAATWAAVLDIQNSVASANANESTTAWIAHPAVRAKWASIQRFSGSGKTLWSTDNTIVGRPAFTTTAAPTTGILFADFSHQIVAFWGESIEVIVDPYSAALSGRISLVINALADVGTLRPTTAVRNADSAVQ